MDKSHYINVPGLFVYPSYFSQMESGSLVRQSLELHARLNATIPTDAEPTRAEIPQPEFVRSQEHNLASEEVYVRLSIVESQERTIRCEYFPRYGEDGHALCYFQGNSNLPDFVRDGLLDKIDHTIRQEGLVQPEQRLRWKLTMNFYKNLNGSVAGFPYHVDIPSNGVVTMILNVHKEALFQIAKDDLVHDIQLSVGSLLLLSRESRYEWKHRVLPRKTVSEIAGGVERLSLVLGYA